ncbi:MAG: hypothetical protein FVQ79_09265 [Planctomycetes bacterium]|nr:hypothetical protein [Planctomycetota bacterium]
MGMLTPIAENITEFIVRYYDGAQWLDQWPEESESIPALVEVTLIGLKNPDSEKPDFVMKNFIADFPRTGITYETSQEDDEENEESSENNNENGNE